MILSYKCSAECRHCIYACSQRWPADWISEEDFLRFVEFFVQGRAPYALREVLKEIQPLHPAEHFFSDECVTPFLRSWHNHFDNYGNYIPGFCGGISLGDCRELDRLLKEGIDTEQYPIIGFLIDENMKGLYHFAKGRGFTDSEEGYLSKCHLCMELRKNLVLHGDFRELKPKEFYLHLE